MAGALRQALERTARLQRGAARSPAPAGPTPACTPGARWSTSTCPAIPYDGVGLARALNRPAGPRGGRAPGRGGRARSSTPAARPPAARYRYLVWNAPGARPAAGRASPGTCATRSTSAPCGRPPTSSSGTPRLPLVLPPAGGDRRRRAAGAPGDRRPAGPSTEGPRRRRRRRRRGRPACCASRSRPPPSATRWSAPWWASLVEVGRGKENAAGLMERLRAVSRHRMPDPAPAHGLCLVSVAYAGRADRGPAAGIGPAVGPAACPPLPGALSWYVGSRDPRDR